MKVFKNTLVLFLALSSNSVLAEPLPRSESLLERAINRLRETNLLSEENHLNPASIKQFTCHAEESWRPFTSNVVRHYLQFVTTDKQIVSFDSFASRQDCIDAMWKNHGFIAKARKENRMLFVHVKGNAKTFFNLSQIAADEGLEKKLTKNLVALQGKRELKAASVQALLKKELSHEQPSEHASSVFKASAQKSQSAN